MSDATTNNGLVEAKRFDLTLSSQAEEKFPEQNFSKVELIPRFTGDELERRMKACFEFDMSEVLARYMKDEGVDETTAQLHERELKRFLFLIAAYSNNFQMRGPIDELWHVFIMHSIKYFQFSRTVLGTYIHHLPEPLEKPSVSKQMEGRQQYKLTWMGYRSLYGEYPVKECWPQLFMIESDIIQGETEDSDESTCVMCDGTNCGIANCSDTRGCFIGDPCGPPCFP